MKYEKPFLTFEEQADLLLRRGMNADRDVLVQCLQEVGYYRLSGYWHIHKKRDSDNFWEGTSFQRVWEMYVFDRRFRLTVFDAIERIEVYMHTQLAHLLSEATGPFGYMNRANLPRLKGDDYDRFIGKCRDAYSRAKSGESFAKHFDKKYGDSHELPPYWMLVNVMDFGMVVTLYKGSPIPVRHRIADGLGVSAKVLDSWLVTLNTVRNICAHHGRLWNRIIGNPPMLPRADGWRSPYMVKNDKMFGTLTVLGHLMDRVVSGSGWHENVLGMVRELSQRNQMRMGFVGDWHRCPIWESHIS